jgi:hypothetical protein
VVEFKPATLRDDWEWVRQGLLTIARKTNLRAWPEDVYNDVANGRSFLWFMYDGEERAGFLILQLDKDPDGRVLRVMGFWAEPSKWKACKASSYDGLAALARTVGAKRIRMGSPRRGWAKEGFFREVSRVYEHEL